jgi:hypothetical protein
MRRGFVALSALTLVGLGLTGCGLFRFEQREPWRAQAEEACLSQRLVQPSAYMSRASRIDGPGACGVDYPFRVAAFSGGTVGVAKQVTLACPIIPRIDMWLDEVVKPAAALYFGSSVVDLRAGSYSCRPQNNQSSARLSEHAFGNALDVMAFVLADGREVTVVKGWRGTPQEQEFLREVFVGACRYFATVLGPGADMFHHDHLHIDLARHDPRGERRICKPILKFSPRLDGAQAMRAQPDAITAHRAPVDVEEEPAEAPLARTAIPSRPQAPAPAVAQQTYAASPGSTWTSGAAPQSVSRTAPPPSQQRDVSAAPSGPLFPEPYRAPLYNRPPVAGQPPQLLNPHGIY